MEDHYAWKGNKARPETKRARVQRSMKLGTCELCGETATDRHHKDGDPGNNSIENVQPLCRRCHMKVDGRLEVFKSTCRGLKPIKGTGKYPSNWKFISDDVCRAAGHRCIRCGHPYLKGNHGRGEWTDCDEKCTHGGPVRILNGVTQAQWRILTVHHVDGRKDNCEWYNLVALCQRCHLSVQSRVNPENPFIFEHTDWFKPYAAGFYAWKYQGLLLTREEVNEQLIDLLKLEQLC